MCSYGHMTSCHFPHTCEEADCSHYHQNIENEYYGDEDF